MANILMILSSQKWRFVTLLDVIESLISLGNCNVHNTLTFNRTRDLLINGVNNCRLNNEKNYCL